MSNFVIIDNDKLKFNSQFGLNKVTPISPQKINGSGTALIEGKKICVLGDEKKVSISASYTKPNYQIPGKGTITISQLSADQQVDFVIAKNVVIVAGNKFIAQFKPEVPAMDPQRGPDPDKSPAMGTGEFINSQSYVTAS